MRIKFLLFLMLLSCGILNAQDTIRSLIITEARMNRPALAYVELTNMGDATINLSEFEFGKVGAWDARDDDSIWFDIPENAYMMLPDIELAPGESYVISSIEDWRKEKEAIDPFEYGYRDGKTDILMQDVDFFYHQPEAPGSDPTDSITPNYQIMETWNGRDVWYVRHHVSDDDSVVIDQVAGVFDEDDGTNLNQAYDVAGFTDATGNTVLYRKFKYKKGNIDFDGGRGVDLEDSEWIPIPFLGDNDGRRASFWTIGNHDNYVLNETTLTSPSMDINWTDSVLTVPWGVRRDDSLMFKFDKVPGLAWHYDYAETFEDSAYISARTGDKITIYAIGDELQEITFDIAVADPTEDANIVIPKRPVVLDKTDDDYGYYTGGRAGLYDAYCTVTNGMAGMDTIKHNNGFVGIPFATRKDSLLKYLEKAPNATWEIVYVDGEERTDLKEGDILKVTAEDGTSVKEYYISIDQYRPSHEALLASITWPDIPEDMKGYFGWIGDTVPNFAPTTFNYKFEIPYDVEVNGIPALVAKPEDLNAKIDVDRASTLFGTLEDKTITFTVTAEDDTSINEYSVQVFQEKDASKLQPYMGDPFISQYVFRDQWNNTFIEICNPNDEIMDLSNYMFVNGYEPDPAVAISNVIEDEEEPRADWLGRYRKYIPGKKWQSYSEWAVERYIAIPDNNINQLVQPKDVFVMTHLQGLGNSDGQNWPARGQWDIDFSTMEIEGNPDIGNPWGEEINTNTVVEQWLAGQFMIFKILNDSVKEGLKPATDPNDFELIEAWGSGVLDENPSPVGVDYDQIQSYTRKPQYYQGHPEFQASYGVTEEDSEWTMTDRNYYSSRGHGWPQDILLVTDGLGSHFMDQITVHLSTVTSPLYKVSDGYSMEEEILGLVSGTTVDDFLDKLIPADAGQTHTLVSTSDGSEKTGEDVLMNSDTLVVMSADSVNTSKYILEVTAEGTLSSDAILTSTEYTIEVDGEMGTVGGIQYGASIADVVANVTVPAGASMDIVDGNDAYISLKVLNFDTVYVDAQVSDDVYFDVVAEDGVTKVLYQIMPDTTGMAPIVTSNVYDVDQDQSIIDLIPQGSTVAALHKHLVPSTGADFKIYDKFGFERTLGTVAKDDKIVVTTINGEKSTTYYLAILDETVNYLAYILSDTYAVDQLGLTVLVEAETEPDVSQFTSNISPAPEASIVIRDSEGAEKATDAMMADGDVVTVTAGNGVSTVSYTVDVEIVVGIDDETNSSISIYPNPSQGEINITGLTSGNRIQVYNLAGVRLQDRIAYQAKEVINLDDQPNGMYFIVISNDDDVIGRYKLIRK